LSRTNPVLPGGPTAVVGGVLYAVLNVLHLAVMMPFPGNFVVKGPGR
jgi:hypothetical protein